MTPLEDFPLHEICIPIFKIKTLAYIIMNTIIIIIIILYNCTIITWHKVLASKSNVEKELKKIYHKYTSVKYIYIIYIDKT